LVFGNDDLFAEGSAGMLFWSERGVFVSFALDLDAYAVCG
jgi:hypothetical protein